METYKPNLSDAERKTSKKTYSRSDVAKLVSCGKLLIQAVKLGNETLARKLIAAGVPVFINDQLGCSPVYYAVRYNHLSILKMLISARAHVNAATKMNRTPLQIAAYHGHIDCLVYLLQHNANVNAVDCLMMSALHWAAENNNLETVRSLLEAGADRTLVNKFGKTALDLACARNNTDVCKLLRHEAESELFVYDNILAKDEERDGEPLSALFIPDKSAMTPESSILEKAIHGIETRMITANQNATIELFEQHGIKLLPVDQSTIIASAVKRGQTAVLTEAGKLALKKTEPGIVRRLANVPSTSIRPAQVPPVKRKKVDEKPSYSVDDVKVTKTDNVPKAKIIKIDASQLVNLTTNKKLIINRSSLFGKLDTKINSANMKIVNSKSMSPENSSVTKCNTIMVNQLKEQLKKKFQLLNDLKKQLEVSMQLATVYKSKYEECKSRYEVKEREAALYKTQLVNLTKMLSRSGIKMSKMPAENVIRKY